ncbi:hypothetical protein L227DRAFT_578987 [Lentinus tigrinus ALCF2SS1-6]|uniref:F-box domain-containing protein n=2 Tax=Lentinus tigrinus TaxID=5365 RepID=A0A5C2RYU5_9APHY|nr:hypothetical protein L227DRAFT_578987 [Lentinus tigrinus ALCF2SS1-6]
MTADLEVIAATAQQLARDCRALLEKDNRHRVDLETFSAIERDLNVSLVSFKRYYNATPSVPINRLHHEILGMIFERLRDPRRAPEVRNQLVFDSYLPLVKAMLVCRRWHAAIMHHPLLWTEIDLLFQRPNTVCNLLERSNSAPIDVRLDNHEHYACEEVHTVARALLEDHAHRILHLDMTSFMSDDFQKAFPWVKRPMPRLRRLAFTLDPGTRHHRERPFVSFAHCPSLKTLTLSGILVLPTQPIPSLTHVVVSGRKSPYGCLSSLLRLLGSTPALECLELSSITWSTQEVSRDSYPTLRRLRSLKIRHFCTREVVDGFVYHLGHPMLSELTLTQVSGQYSWSPPYLPETFLRAHTMTRLKVVDRGWHESGTLTLENARASVTLELTRGLLTSSRGRPPNPSFLADIEDAHVSLEGRDGTNNISWLGSRVPKLKTLVIKFREGNRQLLIALASALEVTVYFPSLVSLELSGSSATWEEIDLLAPALAVRAQVARHRLALLRVQ